MGSAWDATMRSSRSTATPPASSPARPIWSASPRSVFAARLFPRSLRCPGFPRHSDREWGRGDGQWRPMERVATPCGNAAPRSWCARCSSIRRRDGNSSDRPRARPARGEAVVTLALRIRAWASSSTPTVNSVCTRRRASHWRSASQHLWGGIAGHAGSGRVRGRRLPHSRICTATCRCATHRPAHTALRERTPVPGQLLGPGRGGRVSLGDQPRGTGPRWYLDVSGAAW